MIIDITKQKRITTKLMQQINDFLNQDCHKTVFINDEKLETVDAQVCKIFFALKTLSEFEFDSSSIISFKSDTDELIIRYDQYLQICDKIIKSIKTVYHIKIMRTINDSVIEDSYIEDENKKLAIEKMNKISSLYQIKSRVDKSKIFYKIWTTLEPSEWSMLEDLTKFGIVSIKEK